MIRNQSLFLLFISSFFMTTTSMAQSTGKITGSIVADDGTPSSFATVGLYAAVDSSMVKANTTDTDGHFQLVGVRSGQYFIEVTYVGFEDYRTEVFDYEAPRPYSIPTIGLTTASEVLDEVSIVGVRPIVEVHPDKTVFNVDGSVNAVGHTALELLQKSPGVVVDNNDNILLAGKDGVQVYIDDRKSPLEGDDLASFLKNLQSTEIDAIEVVSNPGARYDAEGNAGIINIRLKKDQSLGANGNVQLGYAIGTFAKYNTSLAFNVRNKKTNLYGNYGFNTGRSINHMEMTRQLKGQSYDQKNDFNRDRDNHNLRLGTDFFLSEKSVIGVLLGGTINQNTFIGHSKTDISDMENTDIHTILTANNRNESSRNRLTANANYTFQEDDDARFNLDLDLGYYHNTTESFQPNLYRDAMSGETIDENNYASDTPTDILIYTAKSDYENNWLGGRMGFGAKVSLIETDNTFDFFDVDEDGRYQIDPERSNQFSYTENINAAYVTYQREFDQKWNMHVGLRVENTNSEGDLTSEVPTVDDLVVRHFTDIFPSAGLTWTSGEKNTWRVNYSRRIDRPNYQNLNPFEWQLDELSFMKGNAFLRPQYANVYSIGHTYGHRLNTSLTYTYVSDVFNRITQPLDTATSSASILTWANLAERSHLAMTMSYPVDITKWWSLYTNITGYHLKNEADLEQDRIDIDVWAANIFAQNTFLLPWDMKLELSAFYNSPSIWEGNWHNDAMYWTDIGLQKKLFGDAATLRVSLSDVFNTQGWSGNSRFGDLQISGMGRWESQQLKINFTYHIGSRDVKASRQRKTGQEDELERIDSGDNN